MHGCRRGPQCLIIVFRASLRCSHPTAAGVERLPRNTRRSSFISRCLILDLRASLHTRRAPAASYVSIILLIPIPQPPNASKNAARSTEALAYEPLGSRPHCIMLHYIRRVRARPTAVYSRSSHLLVPIIPAALVPSGDEGSGTFRTTMPHLRIRGYNNGGLASGSISVRTYSYTSPFLSACVPFCVCGRISASLDGTSPDPQGNPVTYGGGSRSYPI